MTMPVPAPEPGSRPPPPWVLMLTTAGSTRARMPWTSAGLGRALVFELNRGVVTLLDEELEGFSTSAPMTPPTNPAMRMATRPATIHSRPGPPGLLRGASAWGWVRVGLSGGRGPGGSSDHGGVTGRMNGSVWGPGAGALGSPGGDCAAGDQGETSWPGCASPSGWPSGPASAGLSDCGGLLSWPPSGPPACPSLMASPFGSGCAPAWLSVGHSRPQSCEGPENRLGAHEELISCDPLA